MNVVLCQEAKGTGRQTNDTGRRTKGIEGTRNELNAVHIQLWEICKGNICSSYFGGKKTNISLSSPLFFLFPYYE
jgi:hypothetical protein